MQFLVIQPPDNYKERFIPLGAAAVAAIARNAGCDVSTLDIKPFDLTPGNVLDILKKTDYDIAAISGIIHQFSYIEWLTNSIRRIRPSAKIILGGPAASSAHSYFAQTCDVDAIFVGEAESSLPAWLKAVETGQPPPAITGIRLRQPDGSMSITSHAFTENIDDCPMPAWDLFYMDVYLRASSQFYVGSEFPIITSKGCLDKCIFCRRTKFPKMRFHSTERSLEEIAIIHEKYGVNCISIFDDNFGASEEHIDSFCEALIGYNHKVYWGCALRAEFDNRHLLRKMRRAGCRAVSVGLESGSEKVLRSLGKRLSPKTAANSLKIFREEGFEVYYNFIIGAPAETRETVDETIDFASKNDLPIKRITPLTPIPDTALWDIAISRGHIKDGLSFLRNISFDHTALNMTSMSDDELEALFQQVRQGTGDEKFSLSRSRIAELFDQDTVDSAWVNSLLRNDHFPHFFTHAGSPGIHQDIRLYHDAPFVESDVRVRLSRGNEQDSNLTLTGAEPLDSPHLEKILGYSETNFFIEVRLETNGEKLCDASYAKHIVDLGVTEFAITLCGPDAPLHNLHTRSPHSFDRTMKGISNLVGLEVPLMAVVPVTALNVTRLPQFAPLLKQYGVRVVSIAYNPVPNPDSNDVFCNYSRLSEYLCDAIDTIRGTGIAIRVDGVPPCVLGRHAALYFSKSTPYAIDTLSPPVKHPAAGTGHIQGQMCRRCAMMVNCIGISRATRALFGWNGISPLIHKPS